MFGNPESEMRQLSDGLRLSSSFLSRVKARGPEMHRDQGIAKGKKINFDFFCKINGEPSIF